MPSPVPPAPSQSNPRLLALLRRQLRLGHYSLRTEQAYVGWVRSPLTPASEGDSRRTRAHAELDEASRLLAERLAQVISALDNLRVDLVRLHAGVATPDDVSDALRAAEEVRSDISLLLAGEREISQLLHE